MNKLLYRIVFNKARGMLMVVSELARGCSGSAPSSGISHNHQRLICRIGAISLGLWLASGAITVQAVGIVADQSAPNKQQATIISTANGTPQVNIQTPSAGGVSRNTYSRFDVGQNGVILNNSHKNTATQLGGMVAANPWLAKGEAKIILNEVNARDPSQLNGFIEVAGQKADVVIASPSGITCNGCGFINAGRATLTTGTAHMQNGKITGYQVEQGEIHINGNGLDSTGQNHTDIIGRAVKVNAAIHAQDLRVTTGRNRVDVAHEQIAALVDNGAAKPSLALDVSQVGGMYAGKIRLRGTEKGVGVRNAGNIGAEAGMVTLSADGQIQNSGAVWSSADVAIAGTAEVQNSGSIAAQHNVSLTGKTITSTGTLAAGVQPDGKLGSGGELTLSASGKLELHGRNLAGGNLNASGQGLEASGSLTQAKNITLNAGQGDLSTASAQIVADDTLSAITSGTLDNRSGVLAAGKLTLTAKTIQNQKGQISQSGTEALALNQQGGIDNRDGMIAANAAITVNTASLDNRKGHILAAETGSLSVQTTGGVDNHGGVLAAAQNVSVTTDTLRNDNGFISAENGHIALTSKKQVTNVGGQIAARSTLALDSGALDNDSGGLVQSGGDLTLNSEHISNRDSGDAGGIVSQGNMSITTNDLQNNTGVVLAGKRATVDAARFSNIAGTLAALEALKLATQSDTDNRQGIIQGKGISLNTHGHLLDNQQGTLYSLAAMQLATGELNNQNGTFGAKGDITLKATSLDNRTGGRVVSDQAIALELERVDNQQGEIQSLGNLMVNAVSGFIDNTLGLMRSGATVTLHAASLVNRNTQAAEKGIEGLEINIVSQQLDNTQGTVLSADTLNIANAGTLDNTQGELSAAGEMSLSGAALRLINTRGVTLAGEKATIDAEGLTGDGRLLSLGEMTINTRQAFDNLGDVIANGNLTFTTSGSVTNSGNLLAGEKLNFSAASLLNTTAGEIAAGATWLTVTAALNNYGLIDGSQTWLKADTLTNAGTGRIYGDHLSLQATTLNNLAQGEKAATIAGRQRVDIGADTINNRDHALIYSDGALAIGGQVNENGFATGQACTLNNHSATIESAGDMILSVSQLNNINDRFSTEVQWVSTEQMLEYQHKGSPDRWDASTEGVFVDRNSADKLLNLNTPDDTGANNDNFYEYSYTRTIEEEVIAESDPGKILSGGQMVISANHVLNDKSQIVAGGTLGIFADTVDNVMPEGSRWITDAGSVTHYSRKSKKGGDSQGKSTSDYVPPTVIQSITLSPGRMDGNSQTKGSGMTLSPATARGTDATLNETGGLSVGVDAASPESPASDRSGKWSEISASGAGNGVIRAIVPDTRLPDSSLFNTLPAPDAHYLIETDPRFTNNKTWLGSDYMQNAFALNHDNMHKRLGDGYYEQRLVREQIIALTGGRYLGDHRDDETQFRALMEAGIAFGKAHQLIPGVALTAEQMSALTEDMVWLVNTRVQLADGSWQTVMVPQVYVRVQPGDVDGSGALIGGQNVMMNLNRDLVNSGTLHGREVVQLSADMLTNRAGTIQGADVSLLARTDINNIGGTISGHNSVLATAARDINLTTTTRSAENTSGKNSFERTTLERVAGIYVQGDDGKLVLNAGQDLNLTAAQVVNSGSDSQTILHAGRDLNLATVTTSASDNLTWDKDNWLRQATLQQAGSEVAGEGSLLMMAGRDLNAEAASVEAGKSLGVSAGRDISIVAATDRSEFESHHKSTSSSSAFSKKTITTHDVVNSETAQGSLFSGDSVTMQAGRDLLVQGSDVVGDNDLRLSAQNNLTITTAEERSQESHQRQEKRSGFSGTGGIGFSYGSQELKVTDKGQAVTHQGSTVGSVNGDVTLTAGNALQVNGSDLVAGHDMRLTGKDVRIVAATQSSSQTHTVEQKSSGLTLALSGSAGSALDSAVRTTTRASEADSGRLAALQAVKAGLYGVQTSQAFRLDQATGDQKGNDNTVGISLSYGAQSSKTTQTREQTHASGSSLTAGNNLTVVATDGDVLVQGSSLAAENDMLIQASRDLNLISAQNTSRLDGKNESHGGSAGVGIGYGSGGVGINFSAGLNAGKGKEKGNATTYTETTLNAGNNLVIASGRDTTLSGAQASGEHIVADVGRNLTLQSQQDTDSYNSTQKGVSAGGNFSLGTMTGSGGISASRDKMDSDYTSVQEQTGIFAGDGGFDIRTGGHTQLDGAVIASTAAAENNRLDTGTLGWRDIHNHAEYSVEHQSAGFSSGGASIDGQFTGNMASNLLAGMNNHDSAEGTTRSAIAQGDIIIRDPASQTQDSARLSRDTANASDTVDVIFDKAREQRRLDEAQLISDTGSQMSDIARTEGQIAQQNAMKDPAALRAAEEQLRAGGNASPTPQEIADQAGRTAMAEYGTGSDIQRAIQAATAAVKGAAGSDLSAALAGAAAPYVAEVIGHRSGLEDGMGKAAAHAVANAALAALQGQNALAGAAGAVTGELAGTIAKEMYGKEVAELSESQKQTISSLATIAAGIAGGLAGDGTAAALAGAQSGKTVVENNSLAHVLAAAEANKPGTIEKWQEEQQAAIKEACSGDTPISCQMAVAAIGTLMSGGVLPEAMVISGAISAGAVSGVDLAMKGSIDPKNVIAAYWIGTLTRNTGLETTIAINAAGGATTSYLDGKNPWIGGLVSGLTGGAAYGIGNKVVEPAMDEVFNPIWKNLGWDDIGRGISKPVQPNLWPSVAGATSGTSGGEYISNKVNDEIDEVESNSKGKNK